MNRLISAWNERWQVLPAASRQRLLWAIGLALALLLYFVAIRPAWHTLAGSSARHATLDAQLAQMQNQAAQVSALRAKPVITTTQAAGWLEQQGKARLGAGTLLQVQGNEATLTLKNTGSQALADFITQARQSAASTPVQAKLTRNSPSKPGEAPTWSGTLVLRLPAAS